MAKNISEAVREVCLAFPQAEEKPSRGSPDFRVGGKTFATYIVNHHGDGNIALWLNAPPGAQEHYAGNEPEHYFVPPYVGPRGWLGIHLDRGLRWTTIAERVREAYSKVATKTLVDQIGSTIEIEPPTETLPPDEFDPLSSSPRAPTTMVPASMDTDSPNWSPVAPSLAVSLTSSVVSLQVAPGRTKTYAAPTSAVVLGML